MDPSRVRCRPSKLLAPCAFLAACQGAPLGPSSAQARLEIANPEHRTLRLSVVEGDTVRPLVELGAAATHRLVVVPGAYVVHAKHAHGEIAFPAPLLPNALPADATLRLVVNVSPPTVDDAAFAFVPAGPAVVGDTLGIGQEDERPARVVDVPAFWLAKHEVTNGEFATFLNGVEGGLDAVWCAFDSKKFRCQLGTDGRWTSDAPQLPVVTVSLAGARAFCSWRSRVTGVPHRLPREVEWEKAARGPASFVFAYGNVYRRDAANQESGTLREVGSFAANGYGLFDMTGNAFEWTADVYRDPSAAGKPTQGGTHVLRGGSFVLDGMYLRNSFRMRQWPDVRTDDIGFRVARDLSDTGSSDR
ncbi:MAG: SUMF1/EgtB/PvdO family nonheme iron enzyme [Planctomycetes bacterium]|nr:SUMF1/EgtB/PvdO family nonheme iron enzyme [Planctomycetota bacterium]